jgi:peptide deformylase
VPTTVPITDAPFPFSPEIATLINDMFETVYAAPGVGIAAPQIGASHRVFVIDLSVGKVPSERIVLINPEFVRREGMQLVEEGCLSVPGFHATVARPKSVTVRGLDPAGRERVVEAEGFLARAIQHEMDHLDGILFVDRLRAVQRRLILRRIESLRRTGQW